jgi:hypothetical protein
MLDHANQAIEIEDVEVRAEALEQAAEFIEAGAMKTITLRRRLAPKGQR